MQQFEYKIVPAPTRGQKSPGVKGAEARFAHGLETQINALAAHGWEYLRADILPSEERQGLTSSHTVYRSVLVFRRNVQSDVRSPLTSQDDVDDTPDSPEADDPSIDADHEGQDDEAPDPSSKVREHALTSLYSPTDNSKQV